MMYKSHLLVIYHDIHHKSWRVKWVIVDLSVAKR